MKLSRSHIFLLSVFIFLGSLLTFIPHLVTPLPLHIDEWHHISSAFELLDGSYPFGFTASELGFHIILALTSFVFPLTSWYYLFASFWICISSLILFFCIFIGLEDRDDAFWIALLSVAFFITIKTNVNTLGHWFFTPLTFSLPFIFLYSFLFSTVGNQNEPRYLHYGLSLLCILLFIYPLAVLALIIPLCFFLYIRRSFLGFSLSTTLLFFAGISVFGIFVFVLFNDSSLIPFVFTELFTWSSFASHSFRFRPLSLYSASSLLLAIFGLFISTRDSYLRRRLLLLLCFVLFLSLNIAFFLITGISIFSPFQRNLFFLAVCLTPFSAIGLLSLLYFMGRTLSSPTFRRLLYIVFCSLIFFTVLISYFSIPPELRLYSLVGTSDLPGFHFLSKEPTSIVMAPLGISSALYSLSKQNPVATLYFQGDRTTVDLFYHRDTSCDLREHLLVQESASFVWSSELISCNWDLIYESDHVFIYNTTSLLSSKAF